MPSKTRLRLFAVLTVLLGVATVWTAFDSDSPVRIVLLGSLTAYTAVLTAPAVRKRVPRIERVAAMPLGVVGLGASLGGAPTDLPVLFVLLGVGSAVDLLWGPTGNVYGE